MRYKDTRTGSCKGLIGNLDSRCCQSSRFLPHDAMATMTAANPANMNPLIAGLVEVVVKL